MPTVSHDSTLNADVLLAEAIETTGGLDDFGTPGFRNYVGRFVDAYNSEAQPHPGGLEAQADRLRRNLTNRLRVEAEVRLHPEILDEDVSDPIVILGMIRTGTTKLQRLMAQDPQVQRLPYWRILNPAPLSQLTDGEEDPRRTLALAHEQQLAEEQPEMMAVHRLRADEPEEEGVLQMMTYESIMNAITCHTPRYREWMLNHPQDNAYDYLRRLLQYFQWQDGGKQDRPWVLKTPSHLGNLEVLLSTFPRATVVHCHRDPHVATGSACLTHERVRALAGAEVDPTSIGGEVLDLYAGQMAANLEQRDRLGNRAHIVEASYDQIRMDPLSIVDEIYRRRDQVLSSDAVSAMSQWSEANPEREHNTYSYTLEHYGLTEAQVDEAFREYTARFDAR